MKCNNIFFFSRMDGAPICNLLSQKVSISSTFYARILAPKNFKPKTQLCKSLVPKFCTKNVWVKCWWNWLKDILLLYSSVLRERRVVVISYSLRYDNLAEVNTNDEKAWMCAVVHVGYGEVQLIKKYFIIQSVSRIKINKARWLFLGRFWPLLNQAVFFEAAEEVLEISLSLKLYHHRESVKCSVHSVSQILAS